MEGLLSSPGWGWVTSAPNMMVGLSVTKGMHLDTASASTVFLPPTFESKSVGFNNRKNATKIKAESMKTNLDIYLQSKICQYLFVHLKNLLCAAALRNYPKVYFADTLQITWYQQRTFDSNYMLNSTGINLKVAHSFKFIYHKENHCCQEVFLQANQVPCAVVQACSLHHGTWLSGLAPLEQDLHT